MKYNSIVTSIPIETNLLVFKKTSSCFSNRYQNNSDFYLLLSYTQIFLSETLLIFYHVNL